MEILLQCGTYKIFFKNARARQTLFVTHQKYDTCAKKESDKIVTYPVF